MGKHLDKFKNKGKELKKKIDKVTTETGIVDEKDFEDLDDDYDDDDFNDDKYYSDVGIQQGQKPESFHHFILENQYQDLERSIRGFKEVYSKKKGEWKTIRKKQHCFTDEEAEDILRTAQSHLSTDIKLGYISKESFPKYMDTLYKKLAFIFRSIAEYRYGRYNKKDKDGKYIEEDYEKQYQMKVQNLKIFLELFTRVQANYSRAIQGSENKLTHGSVKGQESLQNTEQDLSDINRLKYS